MISAESVTSEESSSGKEVVEAGKERKKSQRVKSLQRAKVGAAKLSKVAQSKKRVDDDDGLGGESGDEVTEQQETGAGVDDDDDPAAAAADDEDGGGENSDDDKEPPVKRRNVDSGGKGKSGTNKGRGAKGGGKKQHVPLQQLEPRTFDDDEQHASDNTVSG